MLAADFVDPLECLGRQAALCVIRKPLLEVVTNSDLGRLHIAAVVDVGEPLVELPLRVALCPSDRDILGAALAGRRITTEVEFEPP